MAAALTAKASTGELMPTAPRCRRGRERAERGSVLVKRLVEILGAMKVRLLPGTSVARAQQLLGDASNAFQNVRGASRTGPDLWMEYIRQASTQVKMLSQVLPPADLDRVLTTPRYWMLQSLDPAGRSSALMAIMELELDEKIRALDGAAKSLTDDHERFGSAGLIVVPDTNFLLHHPKPVNEFPWHSFATWDIAELIVAIPIRVVDELDKAKLRTEKIQTGKESVRTRARKTLNTFEHWFEHGDRHPLAQGRPSVAVTLLLDDPDRPRLPDADYEIIDNAIALKELTAGRVIIATIDSGMRLRARAAGSTAVTPSDCAGDA